MNIEIITAPNETLKETGFGSYSSCVNILKSLKKAKHCVRLTVCETHNDLEGVLKRNPDLLFLAAKYMVLEKNKCIWFSEFFEDANVPCSGSDFETLQFDSDKTKAKSFLNSKGIKSARHFIAWPEQYKNQIELPLPFPLFIKPINAANSCGIDDDSYVNSFEAYQYKIRSIYNAFGGPALVEQYLSGREFTVAIICAANGKLTVSPVELLVPTSKAGLKILTHTIKENNTEHLQKIATKSEHAFLQNLATSVFKALGLRGFGRIDFKMNDKDEYYFLEANLVPGMNLNTSYFPKAFEIVNDMHFGNVVNAMLDECMFRAEVLAL